MPRTPPSPADRELMAHAAAAGVEVSGDRLEHWRRVGLLPPNERRSLGRGRGSASRPAPGAAELVVWLARNAGRGRRPADLALLAFGQDLAVPQATVREAFVGAARAVRLDLEATMPAGSEPEDVADAAVAAGLTATIVPARVRRIDTALAKAGINWAAPDVAKLDPNPQPEAATASDWAFTAVKMMLEPGSVDLASIAGLMRSLMPLGGAAPFAGLMEYRWPGSEADLSDDELLNDDGGMAILPAGDLRDQLSGLARSVLLSDLREAWQIATDTVAWATGLCDRVEAEIASGQLGPAAHEWIMGAFSMPRMLLCQALTGRSPTPADTARSALMFLFIRDMIRQLRTLMPDGHFELLEHPVAGPHFLVPFMTT